MKFGETTFPIGSFKGQQTAGAYIDQTLSQNLDILAKKIAHDMGFVGLCSGSDQTGNGKSTMMQQVASYLTLKINELHGTKNTFTNKNVVFNAEQLVTRSFALPPYSVIILDEGDDLTEHSMKETTREMKKYFRKCRQLNQILILILPSFFELPKFFALNRTQFLINVKFMGEFERGYFEFFNAKAKKLLYIKGKKEWDYDAHPPNFRGRFFSSYCFFPNLKENVIRYKANKMRDTFDDQNKPKLSRFRIEQQHLRKLFVQVKTRLGNKVLSQDLAQAFGITPTTASMYMNNTDKKQEEKKLIESLTKSLYDNDTIEDGLKNKLDFVLEEKDLDGESGTD